jgi:alpha-tubulin suppressor-like RCC1 family protein
VGNNEAGQCQVGNWTDIIQVAAGVWYTVGLKADGTVVAVGDNTYGQCDVGSWADIIQVAAGNVHTVGLKSDGTVVTAGSSGDEELNTGEWTDIIQVAAGSYHTVGLKSDGTVVAVGPGTMLTKWNLGIVSFYVTYLTISSTIGGEVIRPGEGSFPYYRGRVLNLVAKPEDDYRLVTWTGDVGTVANVNAAQTTITMNGNYSITANFEEKPPVSWALIGGTIAACVIVGLVIFFVRRRRASKRSATKTKRR